MGRRLTAVFAVLLLLFGAYAFWQKRAAQKAEEQLGLDAARTLSATFERASDLRVARLTGEVLAASQGTSGYVFTNTQRTRAPYSVEYYVDLGAVGPSAYRWNERDRIMTVDLPEVTVGAPAVDMARAQVRQDGLYVSRSAGIAMQRDAAGRLSAAAGAKARDPENLARAREAARTAVERLVTGPLAAAGQANVRVAVRFPDERRPPDLSDDQWDVTRSLQEVLGNAT